MRLETRRADYGEGLGLYGRAKLACEPAGAVGIAAVLAGKVPLNGAKAIAVVVSGGNVSPETAAAILAGR